MFACFDPAQNVSSDGVASGQRWLVLAAGLPLTLAGAANNAPSFAGDAGVTAAPVPTSVPDASSAGANGVSLDGYDSLHARGRRSNHHRRYGAVSQRIYARGDQIADGGEVVEIHSDYVIVRRGGRVQRLDFSWTATPGTFRARATGRGSSDAIRGSAQGVAPQDVQPSGAVAPAGGCNRGRRRRTLPRLPRHATE